MDLVTNNSHITIDYYKEWVNPSMPKTRARRLINNATKWYVQSYDENGNKIIEGPYATHTYALRKIAQMLESSTNK